ncbi:MAG: YggS family pyridoxal phosphate-dependent enzyme [Betaproteobacteria bacterium]|nr:YggS family pyridoxal phosphate-dependent enzyme [Betaproteobacteria bacterium]
MSPIESNLQQARRSIDAAIAGCAKTRQQEVSLVAVSKTHSADAVRAAFAAGQRAFGENYAQEGVAKIAVLSGLKPHGIEWHFIGPLQSNKAGLVAAHFDWVQSVDRLKIAHALSARREGPPLQVLIEVNVSNEVSKSGVAPNETLAFAREVAVLPQLNVRGLMSIIEPAADTNLQRAQFQSLKSLFEQGRAEGLGFDTLSMGMSGDFALAIAEGATMVRLGTAIFGARASKSPSQERAA